MEKGTILYTKDGRVIGNAIITEVIPMIMRNPQILLDVTWNYMTYYYKIETDFGNILKLTDKEIYDYFIIGNMMDVKKWRKEKTNLLLRNIMENGN